MKSTMANTLALGMAAALTLALAATELQAAPGLNLIGGRLNIVVPSSHVGARLLLVWDDADQGADPAAWANSHEIAAAVPAADTHYDVDLAALGVTNGQACRLITTDQYQMLDMLKMTSKQTYIDTGIPDADVYALRFGFYGNECSPDNSGQFSNFIGTSEASSGFTMGKNNANFNSWYWCYRGQKLSPRPSVNVDSINNVSFANGKFTVNGAVKYNPLPSGAIGESGRNMYVGTWELKNRYLFGWWSYVQFEDAQGNVILNYIPVQRLGDGTVGFYDRATDKFVTSTGGGAFTAGSVTNNLFSGATSTQAFTPTNLVGLEVLGSRVRVTVPAFYAGESLILVWDNADKGDDPANWAHSSIVADTIGEGGVYTIRLSRLNIPDGQICGVVLGHRLQLLDMLKMPNNKAYINTGIKDSEVYGVRLGFYGNECSGDNTGQFSNFIGTYDTDIIVGDVKVGTGFTIGKNGANFNSWYWNYRGYKAEAASRPSVNTDSINVVAFTNQVFTLNGRTVKSGLEAGAVGESGANMYLGTWAPVWRFLYGWWSYVRFDDADGYAILDYIPAQRVHDGKVGFYDRATGKFVLSSSTGDFTAGTVTNAFATAVHSCQTFMKVDIPTFIIIR